MRMKTVYIIYLLLATLNGFCQQKNWIKDGDFNMDHHFYKEALISFDNALNSDIDSVQKLHVESQKALAYYRLFDYENAEKQYAIVLNNPVIENTDLWLQYAHILRNNEKYEEAIDAYETYGSYSGKYSVIDYYEKACSWSIEHKDSIQNYRIYQTNLETGGRSLGVGYFKNGLVYSQSQSEDFDIKTTFYDISFAEKENDSVFKNSEAYQGELNRSFYEGSPSFTADQKIMFYTGNASERIKYKERKRKKKGYQISSTGVNILKVYQVSLSDSGWVNRKELPFNSNEYSCTHPSISKDGGTLYFVSNMAGGFGGYDLYVSYKTDSSWTEPKNMGPAINTASNEMTPFCMENTIYYSSKGNMGFGGADIFKARFKDGELVDVRNIGKPFNTSKDDFAFVMDEDQEHGYLSSNRSGTHGYDHIYGFTKFEIVYPDTIRGIAMNRITGIPVQGVKVTIEPDLEKVFYKMKETNEKGEIELVLPKNKEFLVTFYAKGFEPKEIVVPPTNREDILALFGSLELIPVAKKDKIITIDKIYFDYDKATIRLESLPALEKILEYLNYYKEINVELSAHTDSRGSDSYNKRLSQKRAESTVKWLIENGVDTSRLVPIGYGESKLVNECKNGVKCSDEEHMKNRRVELKVL